MAPDTAVAAARHRRSLVLRAAVATAIIAGIIATQRIDVEALSATLRQVNPWLVVASAASFFLLMALKSWRWSLLVRQAGLRYGFWSSYRSYLGAFALGIVTPGRLGELARAGQLRVETGAPLGPCIRSVISDRLFDLLFLGAFGPFALWAVLRVSDGAPPLGDVPFAAGVIGLYVIASYAASAAGRLAGRWRPAWRPVALAVDCARDIARDLVGRGAIAASAITLLSYVVYFGASLLLFRACDIQLSFRDAACVTGCLSLVLLLPISIAGIGTREVTFLVLLGWYGVSRESALASSILQFAVFTLFGGLVGAAAILMGPRAARAAHSPPCALVPAAEGQRNVDSTEGRDPKP